MKSMKTLLAVTVFFILSCKKEPVKPDYGPPSPIPCTNIAWIIFNPELLKIENGAIVNEHHTYYEVFHVTQDTVFRFGCKLTYTTDRNCGLKEASMSVNNYIQRTWALSPGLGTDSFYGSIRVKSGDKIDFTLEGKDASMAQLIVR